MARYPARGGKRPWGKTGLFGITHIKSENNRKMHDYMI